MRIVMITHFPQDLSNPAGGVATASIALLRGLGRFPDVELHVITDRAAVHRPDEVARQMIGVYRTVAGGG